MNFYEEDFYHEPSEFEMQMEQFKASLTNSIKDEFTSEMERLKAENAELQHIKENFEDIKGEYEAKKYKLEIEHNELKRKVRNERLVDLLGNHKVLMYSTRGRKVLPEKCDLCDSNRKIKYTTPLGREASEDCFCKKSKVVYSPEEYIRYEFKMNRSENSVTAWYRQYRDDADGFTHDHSIIADSIYSPDMKFEELNNYNTFFKTEEECLAYCEFLNKEVTE